MLAAVRRALTARRVILLLLAVLGAFAVYHT
jgi:hypothetical protein